MAKSKAKATGAIEILKEQHDKVKKAFKEFEKLDREDTETQQQLVQTVCEDLKLHTTLEEELFYPAAREALDDEDIMNEAQVEHETAKMLIEQLENMGADDPNFHATFTVLGEYVMHHVKEEESEMFPQVKKTDLDLEELGGADARAHAGADGRDAGRGERGRLKPDKPKEAAGRRARATRRARARPAPARMSARSATGAARPRAASPARTAKELAASCAPSAAPDRAGSPVGNARQRRLRGGRRHCEPHREPARRAADQCDRAHPRRRPPARARPRRAQHRARIRHPYRGVGVVGAVLRVAAGKAAQRRGRGRRSRRLRTSSTTTSCTAGFAPDSKRIFPLARLLRYLRRARRRALGGGAPRASA